MVSSLPAAILPWLGPSEGRPLRAVVPQDCTLARRVAEFPRCLSSGHFRLPRPAPDDACCLCQGDICVPCQTVCTLGHHTQLSAEFRQMCLTCIGITNPSMVTWCCKKLTCATCRVICMEDCCEQSFSDSDFEGTYGHGDQSCAICEACWPRYKGHLLYCKCGGHIDSDGSNEIEHHTYLCTGQPWTGFIYKLPLDGGMPECICLRCALHAEHAPSPPAMMPLPVPAWGTSSL